MVLQVANWDEHKLAMAAIDSVLEAATQRGGFDSLTKSEQTELTRLALLVEAFEDSIPLMPIRSHYYNS